MLNSELNTTRAALAALAAACMPQGREISGGPDHALIEFVLTHTSHQGLLKAVDLPFKTEPRIAAQILGNGSRVLASDTVPFCLWCAARPAGNYEKALRSTVSGLENRDTTCAIVALSAGREDISKDWLQARERIAFQT